MRRGQTGIGGWRNENSRHFRPRIGGNPHFRPARNYGLRDTPRFPPPCSRPLRLRLNSRSEKIDRKTTDHAERYRYRNHQHNNTYQTQNHPGERQSGSSFQWQRHRNDNHRNTPRDDNCFSYYDDQGADHFHVNSMGDIDHRQIPQGREIYRPTFISPWAHGQQSAEKMHNNNYRHETGTFNRQSVISTEYTGHRPPASDHYGCNPTSVIDNANTFSRSVDDTVDLIRKRLLNRSDPQNSIDNFESCHSNVITDDQKKENINTLQTNLNEQPMRKKYQRQPHTEKSNCAKIKNKIVHQLFKMDKEKIHKLMDNPNSSSKFEYAISSLITESQNSFNRHLRSAAEKSLCDSSTEFIQNDNNTIYEDTFMKQMQCILDPQDTVFLEDIKPFVMAELSKVLQLNEFEQNHCLVDENNISEHHNYSPYSNSMFHQEKFSNAYYVQNNISQTDYDNNKTTSHNHDRYENSQYETRKPTFERRQRAISFHTLDDIKLPETPFYGTERVEKPLPCTGSVGTQDLFDASTEQFSEEDDPFAELDKQYHVEVDHDFIETDDISTPIEARDVCNNNYAKDFKTEPISPNKKIKSVDKEVEVQVQSTLIPESKCSYTINNVLDLKQEPVEMIWSCKNEELLPKSILPLPVKKENDVCHDTENLKFEPDSKDVIRDDDKRDLHTNLKSTSTNSRKRSVDQRPSHRKEKRKKSESCMSESNKQILNKNIIINVNDCASKNSDKCEASKSIFNLFFSKDDTNPITKENKNVSSNDKNFIEKHVKRKETPKKSSEKDRTKRKDSTSISQSTSPTEENLHYNEDSPSKLEFKPSLKPIDMFDEQPRKISIHHAHRNTAPTPSSTKADVIKKNKCKSFLAQQMPKKHVAVQVIRKVHTKETQTISKCCGLKNKKYAIKSTQTDFYIPEKSGNESNDVFERMKEIDLEIQVLLQEKFKLYSSIETKDTGNNSLQTLGMTVLNVSPYREGEHEPPEEILTEDAIVNDFANMPVEELEQIAMETVKEDKDTSYFEIRHRRRKISPQESEKSQSPAPQKIKHTNLKSPNISLIEQIIKDDRPLEDIISLDTLEIPQKAGKTRSNKSKQTSNKKRADRKNKKIKPSIDNVNIKDCSVIIMRTDISQYIKQLHTEPDLQCDTIKEANNKSQKYIDTNLNIIYEQVDDIVEETVMNDMQFDMLDVSEDIVVGESCEIKSLEDKDVVENSTVPVSEEIILDNSQSSMEDISTPAVGQCDECKVYDYSADENLRRDSVIVNGNADAVLALECVENNFLAACLDGNVYYFSGDGQLISTLRGSNLAVTCLTIVKEKYGTTVYTGSLDSRIRYYDLETGLEKGLECNVLSPIQTMDRAWDTVFVGTRTGFVLQFECKNNMLIPVSSVKFSDQSILALRAMKEGPRKVLLVAARSENVTIKDAQTGLLLRTLVGPKMTVYTLLYEDGKVYCGTSSHQIHVFDYASGGHVGTHEGGKGAVCLRASGGLLFAGCYDGCVYVYREGEGRPFAQIRGPSLMLLSLAVVGSKIIAGYKDRSLYIWKIPLCILQEMIL